MDHLKFFANKTLEPTALSRPNFNTFPSSPPIDSRLIDFRLPAMLRTTMGNGLKLIVIPDNELPQVFFRLGLTAGEIYEPANAAGAMELIARLLRKGPSGVSSQEFSDRIDSTGGYLHAAASNDFFYAIGNFLLESAESGIQMLSEMVRIPAFLPEEFEKEKPKVVEDLENEKSSPSYLVQKELLSRIYQGHPYGRFKDEESINRISLEQLIALHSHCFRPDGAVLVIAGDITPEAAVKLAEQNFGDWTPKGEIKTAKRFAAKKQAGRIAFIERPGSQQTSLAVGLPLFPRIHPDLEKVQIANHILGGGSTSRLFQQLREEKGYTYGAYSYLDVNVLGGSWLASAEVRSDAAGAALHDILEIVTSLQKKGVEQEELISAQRYKVGTFPIMHETAGSFARLALGQTLMKLEDDYWEQHIKRLDRVSVENVNRMYRQYLPTENLEIVVVGEPEIGSQLEKFGDITRLSIEEAGKPKR